jgi:hypothetical protein
VEASALPASAGLSRARLGLGAPLLRLRPDEQLVSLFRAGNEDAFRVIHDRYRARMLAYARQMLASSSADPEDAVQEIFVRAYAELARIDVTSRCAPGCTGSPITAVSTSCAVRVRSPSRPARTSARHLDSIPTLESSSARHCDA